MSQAHMPGYWRFLWMFFMQPISLHFLLKECGVDTPGISTINWWRNRKELNENYYRLILCQLFVVFFAVFIYIIFFAIQKFYFNVPFHWNPIDYWGGVFAAGIAFGSSVGFGIGSGFGIASGTWFGWSLSGSWLSRYGVNNCLAISVVVGVFVTMLAWIFESYTWTTLFFLKIIISAWCGSLLGILIIHFRIFVYVVEFLMQFFISKTLPPERALQLIPINFHDLSYFPHPYLSDIIVEGAKTSSKLASNVLNRALRSPGQRAQAVNAIMRLGSNQLFSFLLERDFSSLSTLNGPWLPGRNGGSTLLSTIANCAQFMQAGIGASSAHTSLQYFKDAGQQLQGLDTQLLSSKEPIAPFLPKLVKDWREILAEFVLAAQTEADKLLPNPFIIGVPLTAKQSSGREVFRGRNALIVEVESLLANHENTLSLALIGPRRCGKSSLLNMLGVMLPDTIVVLFDLQDNPVDSAENFYHAIVRVAQGQAWQSHQVRMPDLHLENASPIEALKNWLDQVDAFLSTSQGNVKRILLCIDEFERLETLFPDKERELLQLMGLLRATIQYKRRVRLLVAGAAPFDELGKIWNDHFINLREIRLGFLDRMTVCELLIAPIEGFPQEVISAEIANEIFARCKGQPFLTQCYAHALIIRLNIAERRMATLEDIEEIEPEILQGATYYFRGIWQEIPSPTQTVLNALAHAEQVELTREMRRWLRRRLLINDEGELYVPLFGRWLREKDEMA